MELGLRDVMRGTTLEALGGGIAGSGGLAADRERGAQPRAARSAAASSRAWTTASGRPPGPTSSPSAGDLGEADGVVDASSSRRRPPPSSSTASPTVAHVDRPTPARSRPG